jgi:hypothetical protein
MRAGSLPSTARHHRLFVGSIALVTLIAGCSDSPVGPRRLPVIVSGTFVNRSGAPIPANARAVVLWSTDDEEAYVFGEGTVDRGTNRFTVTFDRDVPNAALMGGSLGIGLVILTTDPALGEGLVPDGYDYSSTVVGATGQHAVIYLEQDPAQYGTDWAASFRRGYNVGRGVDLPGAFDGFAPTGLGSMELIVDDLANIDVVNWS